MNIAAKGKKEGKNGRMRSIVVARENFHPRKGLDDCDIENETCKCQAVHWKLHYDMMLIAMDADKESTMTETEKMRFINMHAKDCITVINIQTEEYAYIMKLPGPMFTDIARRILPLCTSDWAHPVLETKGLPHLFKCKKSSPLDRPGNFIMSLLCSWHSIESGETVWVSPLDAADSKLANGKELQALGEDLENVEDVELLFHLGPICPPSSPSCPLSSPSSSASSTKKSSSDLAQMLPSPRTRGGQQPKIRQKGDSSTKITKGGQEPKIPQKGDSSTKISKGGQQPKIPQNGESTKVSGSSTPTSAKSASPDASPAAMAPSTTPTSAKSASPDASPAAMAPSSTPTSAKSVSPDASPAATAPSTAEPENLFVYDQKLKGPRWTRAAKSNQRFIAKEQYNGLAWETKYHSRQETPGLFTTPPRRGKENERSPFATVSGDESQVLLHSPMRVWTESGDEIQFPSEDPDSQLSNVPRSS
jgi:hypothetical protein